MNPLSADLNFKVCIIVFIARFKKNNFCFCYIECNFINIKPKRKFPKVFIQTFVNSIFIYSIMTLLILILIVNAIALIP